MAYTNIVKNAPLSVRNWAIERRVLPNGQIEQVEHIFFSLKSNAIVDIQPQKGIARVVFNSHSGNAYPSFIYAWKPNKYYVASGGETQAFREYDPITGELKPLNYMSYSVFYENTMKDNTGNRVSPPYETRISTDGFCSFGTPRHQAFAAVQRYNGITGTWDVYNQDPFPAYEVQYGRHLHNAFKVSTTSSPFNGIYSYWYDDSSVSMLDTAIAEGAVASPVVTFGGSRVGYLHTSDRTAASGTRRVLAPVNIAGVDSAGTYLWRIIDVKSPSTWYKNSTNLDGDQGIGGNFTEDAWEDETTASVNTSGWSYGTLSNYNADTGFSDPSYDSSVFYPIVNQVGRFIYVHHYNTNKTNFYCIPYAMQDYPSLNVDNGQLVYPKNWPAWDYRTQMINNNSTLKIYLCNFGGTMGFSSDNEYVGFFNNVDASLQSTGNLGFVRPDTLDFVQYDPVADPSGFVIASVDVNDPTDPNGFQCSSNYWGNETDITINEEEWKTGPGGYYTSAVRADFKIVVSPTDEKCRIVFDVVPDYTKPHQIYQLGVDNVPTLFGSLQGVVELGTDQLLFAGVVYAGIVAMDRDDMTGSLTAVKYITDVISFRSSVRINSTKAIFHGYLNKSEIVDGADWPLVVQKSVFNGQVNQMMGYANLNSSYGIAYGQQVRTASYRNTYAYMDYLDIANDTFTELPNRPQNIDAKSGLDFRTKLSLLQASYTDSQVEDAVLIYLAANPTETRMDIINDALATTMFRGNQVSCYGGSKCIFSLNYNQLSALRGIAIYDQPGLMGTKYDETWYDATFWPSCFYFDKADPSTLLSSDYKIVQFQVIDQPSPGDTLLAKSSIGKVAITDSHLGFFYNDYVNSRTIVYIILKSSFESKATTTGIVTAFDLVITIPTLSTNDSYGVGNGTGTAYDYDDGNNRWNNWMATSGNYVYFTFTGNQDLGGGVYEAVKRIDLSTGTVVDWCTSTSQTIKGFNYNPDTNTAFVVQGTTAYRVPNFTTLTPPFALT